MMNRIALTMNGPRAISAVHAQQMSVAHTRNGIRLRARSVIAPSSGLRQNMMPIDNALILPSRLSARSEPTSALTKSEK
jgi:hypothetical protein